MDMTAFRDGSPGGEREVLFDDEEVFFSRTDPHGIIQDGNDVFQRISGFSWSELVGRPHKIIRHPGTPRAVFRLLWTEIKAGRPLGAYVRNRTKNGGYYWVFALVTPVADGYVSVRMRPGSQFFRTAQQEYERLAAFEQETGSDPDVGLAELARRLQSREFVDYSDFMSAAFGAELIERDARMERPRDETTATLLELRQAGSSLIRHAQTIALEYERNAFLPVNFKILAARLGTRGVAMGAVATNYVVISEELHRCVAQFNASARDVYMAIQDGVFRACGARIQREMAVRFRAEAGAEEGDGHRASENIAVLDELQHEYETRAMAGLAAIARKSAEFIHDCTEMKRLTAGLEITRLLGKMESANFSESGSLDGVLADLGSFQKLVATNLRSIETYTSYVRAASMAILRDKAALADL